MLGIAAIASYVPAGRLSNYDRKAEFGIDDAFIEDKIGFRSVARMAPGETTSDLCVRAFEALKCKVSIDPAAIEAVVVVTQNPDRNIPHVSAVVHGRLGLSTSCAAFDVSLGCSGYVHGLSIVQGFMAANGYKRALLFTADPYSKIIDASDKNTVLLFGDAATVSLLSDAPVFVPGRFRFGTLGVESENLAITGGHLYMNGRAIFSFVARNIPSDVNALLAANGLAIGDVDRFLFHPGSRYVVDAISKALKLTQDKVPFSASDCGNTVSSSIPLLLEAEIPRAASGTILMSGFGVGLSWASTILTRVS